MSGYSRLPLIQNPFLVGDEEHIGDGRDAREKKVPDQNEVSVLDGPVFRGGGSSNHLQLFFDLFFVANLSSFTELHEINSSKALTSYVGYFCLLWMYWCQVTMYDVRFGTDSILERVTHGCHFGVMIGFAVVGPTFTELHDKTPYASLESLSLILMVGRVVLLVQYLSTLFYAWRYHKTRLPLIAIIVSLLMAIFIYLGIFFAYTTRVNHEVYKVWYAISVFEVGFNIFVSAIWRIVSFKRTDLVERMTCLTLIILGEGVIGLAKSIVKIEKLDFTFTPSAIGTIISALLIIYLYYQLYFDAAVQNEHFGTIRQQIWAFAHFPFHLALVLTLEGSSQFVSWRHIIEYSTRTFARINDVTDQYIDGSATRTQLFDAVNDTVVVVLGDASPFQVNQGIYDEVQRNLELINPATSPKNLTSEEGLTAFNSIVSVIFKTVFSQYGFEPPEVASEHLKTETLDEISQDYYSVFELIFGYTFICAGVCLISIGALSTLSLLKGELKVNRLRWVGIGGCFVLGLGTSLLSIMLVNDTADTLGESAWTLVVLLFVLLTALFLVHIPKKKRGSCDKSHV